MKDSTHDSQRDRESDLLQRAVDGQSDALGELLQSYRDQLTRIVAFRMDPRLRSRVDADDVIQESFIEATQRFDDYVADQKMPFILWLRFITVQKLMQLHRRHLGVQARDAGRVISIFSKPQPQATSAMLAAHLLGKHTSPSVAAMRAEQTLRVERALNSMSDTDREILALRRFERLKNEEVAELLNLSKTAASNRYVRALERLQKEMQGIDGADA